MPIHADLRERLSQRIRRLSLLEQEGGSHGGGAAAEPQGTEAARAESHVHIAGYYAIRKRPPDDRWLAEITAWVRVGGPDRPARLARTRRQVRAQRGRGRSRRPARRRLRRGRCARHGQTSDGPRRDRPRAVRGDPRADLLQHRDGALPPDPGGREPQDRATAEPLVPGERPFYEAQDYARSNTLDAYNQARALYEAALAIYDPRSPACLRPVAAAHALAWCVGTWAHLDLRPGAA